MYEHKNDIVDGFSKRYSLKILVYYEHFNNSNAAIQREKNLKKWKRDWKLKLIEKVNPDWNDLYEQIVDVKETN